MNKSKKWATILTIIATNTLVISLFAATTTLYSTSKVVRRLENTVGAQKAKEIALNHVNLKSGDVLFTKAQLDKDDNIPVYEVEFYHDNIEYDFEIIASTGKIKEFKTEKHISNILGTITKPNVIIPNINTSNNTINISNTTNSQQTLGVQKAKEIALNHTNLNQDNVFFTKAKLDKDDSTLVYEIEFFSNNTKYEYEINAYNGQIQEFKTKNNLSTDLVTPPTDSSSSSNANTNIDATSSISLEQAKQIALNHANLSQNNVFFKKAKLDHDDGMKIYELEFYSNNVEYDYEINASNGAILEFDIDED